MKFETFEDRKQAIKEASVELGRTYGEMKFAEQMLRETVGSFVPGKTEVGQVLEPNKTETVSNPEPDVKVEVEVEAKSKRKRRTKAEIEAEKAEAEPAVEVEVTTEAETEAEPKIKNHEELRDAFTARYKELGGTPEARSALLNKLNDVTGVSQVADVDEAQFEEVFNALQEVTLDLHA